MFQISRQDNYPSVYTAVNKKSDSFPHLISAKLVKANYTEKPQLEAIPDMLVAKDPKFEKNVKAMAVFLRQHVYDIYLSKSTQK